MPDETKTEPIEPEVIEEPKDLAKPGTPVTADGLALLAPGRGEQIILQRAQILATTRASHIRATFPNDWTLFRTAEGQEYGFLADQGCQRGRRLWGISLDNFGPLANDPFYEFREDGDGENYSIRLTADGHCDLTKDTYLHIEGFGYSDDQDAQQVPAGQKRRDRVANHARRNLEGKLIRRSGGLEAVPIEEIAKCWEATKNKVAMCNKGKGYGSKAERMGAQVQQSEIEPQYQPKCDTCNSTMKFIPAGKTQSGKSYQSFWSCPSKEHKCTLSHEQALIEAKRLKTEAGHRESGSEG